MSGKLFHYWTDWKQILERDLQGKERLVAELTEVEKNMQPHEEFEKEVWKAYGMPDADFDHDALLKECQKRVNDSVETGSHASERTIQEQAHLERLDQMHRMRLQKYELIQQLMLGVDQDTIVPRAPLVGSPTQEPAVSYFH